jgi:hypothetical protein
MSLCVLCSYRTIVHGLLNYRSALLVSLVPITPTVLAVTGLQRAFNSRLNMCRVESRACHGELHRLRTERKSTKRVKSMPKRFPSGREGGRSDGKNDRRNPLAVTPVRCRDVEKSSEGRLARPFAHKVSVSCPRLRQGSKPTTSANALLNLGTPPHPIERLANNIAQPCARRWGAI